MDAGIGRARPAYRRLTEMALIPPSQRFFSFMEVGLCCMVSTTPTPYATDGDGHGSRAMGHENTTPMTHDQPQTVIPTLSSIEHHNPCPSS